MLRSVKNALYVPSLIVVVTICVYLFKSLLNLLKLNGPQFLWNVMFSAYERILQARILARKWYLTVLITNRLKKAAHSRRDTVAQIETSTNGCSCSLPCVLLTVRCRFNLIWAEEPKPTLKYDNTLTHIAQLICSRTRKKTSISSAIFFGV